MNKKTICFVAGKSGGHIIPCLTILHNTLAVEQTNVLFFSTNTLLDKKIISNCSAVTHHVMLPLTSFNASRILSYPRVAWHFMYSFITSFMYLITHRPTKVITTGGIVAIPVCIAAYILRIPITLYALDAVPGKALTAVAPLATTIALCFTQTERFFPKNKCLVKPYPVKFCATDKAMDQKTALLNLGLDSNKKTILFLGGSQGSLFLNQCAQQLINDISFSPNTTQIIHQTGSIDTTDWNALYNNKRVTAHIFSYSHNIAAVYQAADYIICRAGAGTLFEILFFEKKCIVIPLKTHTTDHQIDNARAITQAYPEIFEYILQEDVEKNSALLFSKLTSTSTYIMHKDATQPTSPIQ